MFAQADEKAKKSKVAKPAPIDDPNTDRKRQGRRLIVSEVPIEFLPKVAIIGKLLPRMRHFSVLYCTLHRAY